MHAACGLVCLLHVCPVLCLAASLLLNTLLCCLKQHTSALTELLGILGIPSEGVAREYTGRHSLCTRRLCKVAC